jgi:hypothetical protein
MAHNGATSGLSQQIFQNNIVQHDIRHKALELGVLVALGLTLAS